jgi:hypothetical protein
MFEDFDDFHHPDERGMRLEPENQEKLRKQVYRYGTYPVAKAAGVAHNSIARACGGLPIYPGTMRKIRAYLARAGR